MCNNDRYEDELSIFFYKFIKWIMDSCDCDKVEKIYFLTREGEFFKKIYDKIVLLKSIKTVIKADVLEVSRLSTFAPSLQEIRIQEFMRMWSLYRVQSMDAFLCSLGMDSHLFDEYLDKYQIEVLKKIEEPWKDKKIVEFLNNTEVIALMEQEVEVKRNQFYDYCNKKGLIKNHKEKIAIVDIGWRGTMQDNLCILFPQKEIVGYYLSLAPFLNTQPPNAIKYGFLNDRQSKIILRYPTPIEMLCNASGGSVVGYSKCIAIRSKEYEEESCYDKFTYAVQDKIICGIEKGITNGFNQCKKEENQLENLLMHPEKAMVEAFFSLRHNEMFGRGEYVEKKEGINRRLFLKTIVSYKHRKELKEFLWKTSWPQGYLVHVKLKGIVFLYNYILKKHFLD